jgi:hypothetical protein
MYESSTRETHSQISEAQLQANRANAQLSRGPLTPEGKAKSSHNALKTGLTGSTVLLPTDDPDHYNQHVERLFAELKPVGELESQLVQRLADAQWRLNRIPQLERNLYKLGRVQLVGLFENEPEQDQADLVQAYTAITFQKQFQNLSIQENRIRRGYEKDLNELKSLQSQRGKLEKNEDLLNKWPAPWPGGRKNGFEFPKEEEPEPILPVVRVVIKGEGEERNCVDSKCLTPPETAPFQTESSQ